MAFNCQSFRHIVRLNQWIQQFVSRTSASLERQPGLLPHGANSSRGQKCGISAETTPDQNAIAKAGKVIKAES